MSSMVRMPVTGKPAAAVIETEIEAAIALILLNLRTAATGVLGLNRTYSDVSQESSIRQSERLAPCIAAARSSSGSNAA
jgi:hypothetical protein